MDRSNLPAQPQVTPLPTLLVRPEGASAPLRFSDTVTVGRDPRCMITLSERSVSRIHVRIARTEDGWWIQDAHSTNGTYVNGIRVPRRTRLDGAVTIRLGREGPRLHVELAAPAQAPASAGSASSDPAAGTPPGDAPEDRVPEDAETADQEAADRKSTDREAEDGEDDTTVDDAAQPGVPKRPSTVEMARPAPDDSGSDDSASKDAASKDAASKDAASNGSASDGSASDGSGSDGPATGAPAGGRQPDTHPPNALDMEAHDVAPPDPSAVAASVPGPPAPPLPDVDVESVSDVPPEQQTPFVPQAPVRGASARSTPARSAPVHGAGPDANAASSTVDAAPRGPEAASVTQYLAYYFRGEGDEGGEHTRLLREAYARAQHSDRQPFWMALGAILVICLVLSGVVLWQSYQQDRHEALAEQVFQDLKRQDLALAQLRISIEADRPLSTQLVQQERERRMLAARYDGYVQELGLHRRLTEEERIIHRLARVFGESEFSIPAGFIREVNETIDDYWLGPGRARFVEAVERAQANDYVQPIVTAMMDRGLPPEFFYLALQESDFRTDAVGPRTRWGIAKGMWQFIPSTGRTFGLGIGPRAEERIVDPDDDRHDFRKSTQAAAQYLQTIYATEAQASGLLVIASYNWGEHRVTAKLSRLKPYGIPEAAFEGMAQTPQDRNYWRFLTEYRDRIPEETRDYVLKVFAAAVIGSDPEHFGFDFENPLRDAIESAHAALRADPGAVAALR